MARRSFRDRDERNELVDLSRLIMVRANRDLRWRNGTYTDLEGILPYIGMNEVFRECVRAHIDCSEFYYLIIKDDLCFYDGSLFTIARLDDIMLDLKYGGFFHFINSLSMLPHPGASKIFSGLAMPNYPIYKSLPPVYYFDEDKGIRFSRVQGQSDWEIAKFRCLQDIGVPRFAWRFVPVYGRKLGLALDLDLSAAYEMSPYFPGVSFCVTE
jgi:hypothetical protein